MFIIQCDKCKKQSDSQTVPTSPKDWRRITFTIGYPHSQKVYDLCPDCCRLLKLSVGTGQDQSLADRFLDIITDLAQEAVEDAISNQ